jgi:pimeloyl-ACP methyl ester carboxylesterase
LKRNKSTVKILAILPVILLLAGSCKKEEVPDYDYYVSKEFIISYSAQEIISLLNLVSAGFPEVNVLKESVTDNVNVYRIVYTTTVAGEKIKASGLLCVPEGKGEYPVLCFQNGTNTVKSNAPSENAGNPLFQMIEAVAGMGYVVVIPDYPGFGESSEIVHPYLITVPTVQSITDMLYAAREAVNNEFSGIQVKNEYYLIGYSQGGWATLNLHKSIELDYADDFILGGSVCGAGPYDLKMLFSDMIGSPIYKMPVYLGYIAYAYRTYDQFSNSIEEIFNDPYSSKIDDLYDGTHTSAQINEQLTISIPELIKEDLITGFATSPDYLSIRQALEANSVGAWETRIPLLLIHGGDDINVNPLVTEMMYDKLIGEGTSEDICKKEIIPGLDHGKGIVPCMIKGLIFLMEIRDK